MCIRDSPYTGLVLELEHLKIETRLIIMMFASGMGEYSRRRTKKIKIKMKSARFFCFLFDCSDWHTGGFCEGWGKGCRFFSHSNQCAAATIRPHRLRRLVCIIRGPFHIEHHSSLATSSCVQLAPETHQTALGSASALAARARAHLNPFCFPYAIQFWRV